MQGEGGNGDKEKNKSRGENGNRAGKIYSKIYRRFPGQYVPHYSLQPLKPWIRDGPFFETYGLVDEKIRLFKPLEPLADRHILELLQLFFRKGINNTDIFFSIFAHFFQSP
ncbi:MAG: hypothetical protein A2Y48_00805 [Nitrospirae bacterium RIFCSPLOW2_12_42_9]|nr:MAG: hypothetical protein A2Y48_00805 [Nitrospirae bacterium RIFCSPLOW2_12_42_9]